MIGRDPSALDGYPCDLVIIGGGFQGVAVALEAARRGMQPVLIERDDFGAGTSGNSLRIVHGGLRYLQTLDLSRFRESVAERRWFLASFPDLVRPLPCLMPLDGKGFHRPEILRVALAVNDMLSRGRNEGVRPDRRLPSGRVLTVDQTLSRFPAARRPGLRGAAVWYDSVMPDSQRVLLEMLRWAVGLGAQALNYMAAERLVTSGGKVVGVEARDRLTGRSIMLRSPRAILCTGPWNASLAAKLCDRPVQAAPMLLAFNVFLDCSPDFDLAVAVTPERRGGRTYFLYPADGGILAGTFQSPWTAGPEAGHPPERLISEFLSDLRSAMPALEADREKVLRVYWGLLPARAVGTDFLTKRPVLSRLAARGGPSGLYSVTAIKLTTARLVAERALRLMHRDEGCPLPQPNGSRPDAPSQPPPAAEFRRLLAEDPAGLIGIARELLRTESVLCLDDLIHRRTAWGQRPADAESARRLLVQYPEFSGLPARVPAG